MCTVSITEGFSPILYCRPDVVTLVYLIAAYHESVLRKCSKNIQ